MGGEDQAERVVTAGLWALPGPGPKSLQMVRERFPDLSRIVDLPFEKWVPTLEFPSQAGDVVQAARTLGVRTAAESAARLFRRCQATRVQWAFQSDPAYPPALTQIENAPLMLFYRGPAATVDPRFRVAMVGTREVDSDFCKIAGELSRSLARSHLGIISGAARGVDTVCHHGALDVGGETWAFLGSSIDQVDGGSRAVANRILSKQGTLFTEFPPGVRADKTTFPRRNRLISGAADLVVVLRAPAKSGALITGEYARAQGRPLLAVPGEISNPGAHGSNRLLRDGLARPCLGARDVVRALGLPDDTLVEPVETSEAEGLREPTPVEKKILSVLTANPLDYDALLLASGLSSGTLSATLIGLQLDRRVVQLPGRRYCAGK